MSRPPAGRKRPMPIPWEDDRHQLGALVAEAHRRGVPWYALMTEAEIEGVLEPMTGAEVPQQLPSHLAEACSEYFGRAIGTDLDVLRAMRSQVRGRPQGYRAIGSVRGECAHVHRTIGGAWRCAERDHRDCAGRRGYSDRRVRRVDGAPLSPGERDELAALALGAMEARGGALRRRGDRGRDGGAR